MWEVSNEMDLEVICKNLDWIHGVPLVSSCKNGH